MVVINYDKVKNLYVMIFDGFINFVIDVVL